MSLAADGQDGNGLQLEKFFKLFLRFFKQIDIIGRGLFSLCEVRLYLPFDVQR